MQSNVPIPDLDTVALPAPVWLLKGLLLLTFFLHIIPMNLALGGGFVAAFTDRIGRKRESGHHRALAKSLAGMLPIVIAFAITLASHRFSSFRFCMDNSSTLHRCWWGGLGSR
jgi:Na+-driven multidrug efflux pump